MFRKERIKINIPQLASACAGLSSNVLVRKLKDARNFNGIVEAVVCDKYALKDVSLSQLPHDAETILGEKQRISIRMLTLSGVFFQRSQYRGSGRACPKGHLLALKNEFEWVFVVDITSPSEIIVYPISVETIIKCVKKGDITENGMSNLQFQSQFVLTSF